MRRISHASQNDASDTDSSLRCCEARDFHKRVTEDVKDMHLNVFKSTLVSVVDDDRLTGNLREFSSLGTDNDSRLNSIGITAFLRVTR